jgi:hypothetical protein
MILRHLFGQKCRLDELKMLFKRVDCVLCFFGIITAHKIRPNSYEHS